MCGRFILDLADFPRLKGLWEKQQGRIEAFPGQKLPVLHKEDAGAHVIWGYVPRWSNGGRIINARQESLLEKPVFAYDFQHHRLAVPASGYYEWAPASHPSNPKEKFLLYEKRRPFYLAAFAKKLLEGPAFLLITTAAHPQIASIHDRMPLILQEEDLGPWFHDAVAAEELLRRPGPALEAFSENPQRRLFE